MSIVVRGEPRGSCYASHRGSLLMVGADVVPSSVDARRELASKEGLGRCLGRPRDLMTQALPRTHRFWVTEARAPRTTSSFSPYLQTALKSHLRFRGGIAVPW